MIRKRRQSTSGREINVNMATTFLKHAENIISRQGTRSSTYAYRCAAPPRAGVSLRNFRRRPDAGPPTTVGHFFGHRSGSPYTSLVGPGASHPGTAFAAARAISEGANDRTPIAAPQPGHPATSEGAQHPSGARVPHPNTTSTSASGIGAEGHPTCRTATCPHP